MNLPETAALRGGLFFVWQRPLWLVDSITEAVGRSPGAVIVTGSHGGVSSGRFAIQAQPLLVVFNDAGVGKDDAGIAALPILQLQGIAACTVTHRSARIGDAMSTWSDGLVSHANAAALALGCALGLQVQQALPRPTCARESSPGHR